MSKLIRYYWLSFSATLKLNLHYYCFHLFIYTKEIQKVIAVMECFCCMVGSTGEEWLFSDSRSESDMQLVLFGSSPFVQSGCGENWLLILVLKDKCCHSTLEVWPWLLVCNSFTVPYKIFLFPRYITCTVEAWVSKNARHLSVTINR